MAGTCQAGACTDPCSKAEANASYIGCTYWPTITLNPIAAKDFAFAVVVGNDNSEPVEITVSSKDNPAVAKATVPAKGVAPIMLPWKETLKQTRPNAFGYLNESSMLDPDGAYRLTSSLPVAAYQFNPLEYQLDRDCVGALEDKPDDNVCYSFSNDASLLLPDHTLRKEYMVVSWPTIGMDAGGKGAVSGFLAVVATRPGETRITISLSAHTEAGPGVNPFQRGQTAEFVLSQWSVLQLISRRANADSDLTGTKIVADKEVAVFSGHGCAMVPADRKACDHLEEQLLPIVTWGSQYVLTQVTSAGKDPSIYRFVSAAAKTTISFTPEIHPPMVLDEGHFGEITTTEDFVAMGTHPFAAVQYLVGQEYSQPPRADGDPSMALGVPVEQFRPGYLFLAPKTYPKNYVNVVATGGGAVLLDGAPVAEASFSPIGASSFRVARLEISGAPHLIQSTGRVGIMVYGVGPYSSSPDLVALAENAVHQAQAQPGRPGERILQNQIFPGSIPSLDGSKRRGDWLTRSGKSVRVHAYRTAAYRAGDEVLVEAALQGLLVPLTSDGVASARIRKDPSNAPKTTTFTLQEYRRANDAVTQALAL